METANMLDPALDYLAFGFSILPVNPENKKPLLEAWKEYQTRMPTEEEVTKWWTQYPRANIALITGQISGIDVVDIDPRHGGTSEGLTPTLTSETGGGGKHYFYKHHPGLHCKNGIRPGVDLKTNGGYVILPPSIHSSGNVYRWLCASYKDQPLSNLPEIILKAFQSENNESGGWRDNLGGADEGARNETAASVAGKLLAAFKRIEWESVCWPLFKGWNLQNNPPLSEKELRSVFDSISRRESQNSKEPEPVRIHIPNILEFLAQDFGDTAWLIKDLLPVGGSGVIVAKRESYKTWLALYVAECVTNGAPLWGNFPATATKVLYISNDDPAGSFKRRLGQFNFNDSLFIYHQLLPNFSVDTDNGSFPCVKSLIKEKDIGLVIVDILRNVHNKDSNTDKDSMEVINKFKELRAGQPNLVFLLISHPAKETTLEKRFGARKTEEAVGSYYWEAAVDTVISLCKSTDAEQTDSVVVAITKDKQAEQKPKAFIGIKHKINCPIEFIYEESIPDKQKVELAKEAIVEILGVTPNITTAAIIEGVTSSGICGKRNVETALKELTNEGRIFHTKKKPYLYNLVGYDPNDNPQTAGLYKGCGTAGEDNSPDNGLFSQEAEGGAGDAS